MDKVTLSDIQTFAQVGSVDFSFEMRVLRALTHAEFDCRHSWSYQDPVEGKFRQFDITGHADVHLSEGRTGRLHVIVECKTSMVQLTPLSPIWLDGSPKKLFTI